MSEMLHKARHGVVWNSPSSNDQDVHAARKFVEFGGIRLSQSDGTPRSSFKFCEGRCGRVDLVPGILELENFDGEGARRFGIAGGERECKSHARDADGQV